MEVAFRVALLLPMREGLSYTEIARSFPFRFSSLHRAGSVVIANRARQGRGSVSSEQLVKEIAFTV